MSERSSHADRDEAIRQKFRTYTNDALIERIEKAPDFGYDDETVELNRRLKMGGLAWRWAGNKVEVYEPEGNE